MLSPCFAALAYMYRSSVVDLPPMLARLASALRRLLVSKSSNLKQKAEYRIRYGRSFICATRLRAGSVSKAEARILVPYLSFLVP